MSYLVILFVLAICIGIRVLAIFWLALQDLIWCASAWHTPAARERLRVYLGIALHSVALYHGTVTGNRAEFFCALLSSVVFARIWRHVLATDLHNPAGL